MCKCSSSSDDVPSLLARLTLADKEDATFTPARRRLLERLAKAGHAVARFRLGVALSYHPTAVEQDNVAGRAFLYSLARQQSAEPSLRADAAFECWLPAASDAVAAARREQGEPS